LINFSGSSRAALLPNKYFALALLLCCLASPVEAAGIQLLDSDPNLSGAIWYPCAAEPKPVALGRLAVSVDFSLMGTKDCPVTGAKLPLIVFSHGRTGWFGANHDTAAALADAGFVVAAINHPGDNGNDPAQAEDLSVFGSRPADMVRLIDFMLSDWKDRAVIDPVRIGLFGFSKGGYTGLVLIGAVPDFARFARVCKDTAGACQQLHDGATPPRLPQDARIRAAVIVDPASAALTGDGLAAIKVPLQYWRSELGGPGVGDGSGTARIAKDLPGKPDIHVVPAGHFAFLAPCSPQLAAALPCICIDKPAGFDRAAFHRDFNASVAEFFRAHLSVDSGVR
jgi:predicted dienelactone hydrolase